MTHPRRSPFGKRLQRAATVARAIASEDAYSETPGFVYGAYCSVDPNSTYRPLWTWKQCATVLHHHVPSHAESAAALANINPSPVAVHRFHRAG